MARSRTSTFAGTPPTPATAAELPARPPTADDQLYIAAREASERGEMERAAASYRDLLARDPKHVKARNNLALILEARGDRDGRAGRAGRALESEPDNLRCC